MKNLILTLLLLSLSPLTFALDEREPLPVKQDTSTESKPSGDMKWLAERDIWKNIHFKASLDTLSYKSLTKDYELDWSLEFGNVDKSKKEYSLTYTHKYEKDTDLFTREEDRHTEINVTQDFDVNRIAGKMGWTTHISLDQTKENNAYVQKYNIELAPIGIKYDFVENEKISELSLSYLPTYNYLEHYSPLAFEEGSALVKSVERSLLHVVRFKFEYNVNDFTFSDSIHWKKISAFDDAIKDKRDTIFSNELEISYQISESFSVSYKNTIEVDQRRKEFQNLPSTDHQHGISFAFEWN